MAISDPSGEPKPQVPAKRTGSDPLRGSRYQNLLVSMRIPLAGDPNHGANLAIGPEHPKNCVVVMDITTDTIFFFHDWQQLLRAG